MTNISTGGDYKKRVSFKKPWTKENKDEMIQTIFNTVIHKAAVKYMKEKVHKNDTAPTQELNNLSLDKGRDNSESDLSSSSEEEWHKRGTRRSSLCLGLGHEIYNIQYTYTNEERKLGQRTRLQR